jgi:tetrahydromethanopterin S-methyltransferase subunit G
VDKKGRIAFHSVNKKMLSQMRHLCMSLGVPVTNMQHRIVRTTLPNGKGHTSEVYAFTCSDPAKNCLIWSNDARYQERLRNGNPFDRKGRAYPSYGGKDFEVPGCGLSRITSIEKQATEPVYDLEVEGTHSFIANGVIVHNSNIEYQSIEFVMHTLRPWLVRWEQSIFTQLLMPEERKRYFAEFLVEGLLRGDMQSRYQAYATGRQNGWLSADDIRELENMNKLPDGKGEIYLVPLNMVPVDQVMDAPRLPQQQEPDDENARKIAQSLKVEKRQRGVAHRERIMHAWEPIYKDAFDRIVRRERNDLKRLITKNLRDKETMKEALEKFYATDGEFRAYILQVLRPVNQGLAEQIAQAAGDEIGDHITTEELQRFAENYLQSRADNHLGASKNQLMLLLEEEEALEELEQRLDEWDERRADKVAANEAHRAGNAVARTVWIVGGIQVLMWVTMGTNPCEYCELMNGRTVSITKPFLEAGAGISGENGERFEVHESKLHPPLHSACMCGVAPGI